MISREQSRKVAVGVVEVQKSVAAYLTCRPKLGFGNLLASLSVEPVHLVLVVEAKEDGTIGCPVELLADAQVVRVF